MPERLVLALDGSTRVCGAALLWPRRDPPDPGRERSRWEVVARRSEADGRNQAKVLLRLVDDMLHEIGCGPGDLKAVVVGTGPGTFTGVRIAVAGARALGLALEIPVVGVSTLAALAAGEALRVVARAAPPGGTPGDAPVDLIVPVVDARRNQLFCGLYHRCLEACYVRSAPYRVCDRDSLGAVVEGAGGGRAAGVLVVADERALVGDMPTGWAFAEAQVEPAALVSGQELLEEPGEDPQGSRLVPWLLRALDGGAGAEPATASGRDAPAGTFGTPESVRPIYVRSPDADIHILKMRDPFAPVSRRPGPAGGG